uniref:Uncharacterized protein n=1 Tax=Anguilla anguilla TaxID=7936 RepID=A0A0E9QYW5_ANGAN
MNSILLFSLFKRKNLQARWFVQKYSQFLLHSWATEYCMIMNK